MPNADEKLKMIRNIFAELHKQHPHYLLQDVDKFIDDLGDILGFDMSTKKVERRRNNA